MRRVWALRPSPATAISLLALVFAMGGAGYAATALPRNSVGTAQLKNNAVTKAKIKARAVNASKVAPDSLTGAQINELTLGKVPSATTADSAKVTQVKTTTAAGTAGPGLSAATATCDPGLSVVGGGVQVSDALNTFVVDDYPVGTTGFTAHVGNGGGGTSGFTVYAICVTAAAAG